MINGQDYIIRLLADATGATEAINQLSVLDTKYKHLGMSVAPTTKILDAQRTTLFQNGEATNAFRIQTLHADKSINTLNTTVQEGETILSGVSEGTRVASMSAKQYTTANKGLIASQAQLALRALAVVPIWQAMRLAMNLVSTTIKNVISVYTDLDNKMKRVMAVATYTNDTQLKTYKNLEKAVKQYYVTSGASIANITESMYQLGTAGRSTEEMMVGFNSVMNLAIGTFGNVAEAGKVVSGILNVFNDSLEKVGSTSKKIEYISDLLADAWKNNQIELSEINTAMGYLASVGSALDIDLKTLISTTAVMSDGMLRGGKGARYLSQAFVQIAKESNKLRALGVVFDPNKPLDFYNVMSQLKAQFDAQRGSLSYTKDLIGVFGDRGSRAVLSILTQWAKWNEEINKTPEQIEGTAKKLKELAESDWGTILGKFWRRTVTKLDPSGGGLKQFFAEAVVEAETFDNKMKSALEYIANFGVGADTAGIESWFKKISEISRGTINPFKAIKKYLDVGEMVSLQDAIDEIVLLAKVTEDLGVKPFQIPSVGKETDKEVTQQKRIVNFLEKQVERKIDIVDAEAEIMIFLNEEGIMAEELHHAYLNIYNLLVQQKDIIKETTEANRELTFTEKERIRYLEEAHELSMLEISGVDAHIIKWQQVQLTLDKINRARQEAIKNQKEQIKKAEKSGDANALEKAQKQLSDLPKGLQTTIQELLTMSSEQIVKTLKDEGIGESESLEIVKTLLQAQEDKIKKYGDLTKLEQEELDIANQLAVLEASGLFTKEQMLNYEIQLKTNASVAYKDKQGYIELEQLHNKLLVERLNIISNYSDQVKDAFSGAFTDILKGEDITSFIDKFGANMRDSMASNFGNLLGSLASKFVGMGEGYGEGMYSVQSMFADTEQQMKSGADYANIKIYDSFIKGATDAVGILDSTKSASGVSAGDSTGGGNKIISSIASAIPMALGGYSASGVAGGILGGLSGLLSSSFPVIGSILGIGSMLWGNLFGKEEDDEDYSYLAEEHQGVKGVASKIDVTNSELSIVNRNLVALRNTIETYILPSSAYFSEKSGIIEDEFSVDGRRGIT